MCVFGNIFHFLGNGIFNFCFPSISFPNKQVDIRNETEMDGQEYAAAAAAKLL